jgi:2-octaprenyl-6-methoxyphenol hydroxylase
MTTTTRPAFANAPDCDVFIAGGGMAGLTLALALDQAGLDVIVADAQAPSTTLAPHFDGRAFAIAFASFRMWKALGPGVDLEPVAQPIERILVTDGRPMGGVRPGGPSVMHLHFDREEISPGPEGEPLGYMLENRYIRLALDKAVRERSRVRVIAPMGVARSITDATGVSVELNDGRILRAPLLIGCDGRGSLARRQAGIRTVGWPYSVTAIVCTVAHEKSHQGVAHEFFLPEGPFAILPLVGNRANVVWMEKHAAARALLAMPEADFLTELKRRFGDFLGDVRLEGPRFGYPLSLQIAERMIGPRLALAGDSAHGVHPIAGQGLNMGLKDVAALAEVLADAAALGLDLGDAHVLERYQRWRRIDNVAMGLATDFFDRLFSNDIAPVRLARGLGLALVNRIGPARRFFMTYAGGAAGSLPKLLRGERLAA